MRYTVPHYYNKFRCTAGECQDTCCAGWAIMIDDKALLRYRHYPGAFGNRLKNSIHWKNASFRQYEGRCAFLNEENLCDIYTEAGPRYLCGTCRNYPRHIEEFEGCREISLSLSCMEAAKLILGCEEPVRFLHKEKPGEEEYEDFDFLLFTKLTDARNLMIEIMQRRSLDICVRMGMCLGLAHDIQTRIQKNCLYEIDGLLERYQGSRGALCCAQKLKQRTSSPEIRFRRMKGILESLAELECLDRRWPKDLKEHMDCLYGEGAEAYGKRYHMVAPMLGKEKTKQSPWSVWAEQLMVYFLFTYFCGAVYDEHVLSKVKLAVASTLIIKELAMSDGCDEMELDDVIEIAHRYSREVEHSDDNLKRMEEMFETRAVYSFEAMLDVMAYDANFADSFGEL